MSKKTEKDQEASKEGITHITLDFGDPEGLQEQLAILNKNKEEHWLNEMRKARERYLSNHTPDSEAKTLEVVEILFSGCRHHWNRERSKREPREGYISSKEIAQEVKRFITPKVELAEDFRDAATTLDSFGLKGKITSRNPDDPTTESALWLSGKTMEPIATLLAKALEEAGKTPEELGEIIQVLAKVARALEIPQLERKPKKGSGDTTDPIPDAIREAAEALPATMGRGEKTNFINEGLGIFGVTRDYQATYQIIYN